MDDPFAAVLGPWQIPAGRLFHVAMAVDDVAAATGVFGAVFGLTWTRVLPAQIVLDTPAGQVTTPISAVYSREGPPYFELVSGPPGSFFDPGPASPRLHHAGYYVDDVVAEVRRLEALGMTLHGLGPGDEPGIAFLTGGLGFALEVHSPRSRQILLDWFARGA
jgi:catechol 2,3-dioxygenase-like lactoylglutathione lyase family enzyme